MNSECKNVLKELNNIHYQSGFSYKAKHLYNARAKINVSELETIYHLTESHSPSFRYRGTILYEKSMEDSCVNVMPLQKDNFTFSCSTTDVNAEVQKMIDIIEELPKEWTLVQLTPGFNLKKAVEVNLHALYTNPLHITIFNCGQCTRKPITLCVDPPRDHLGNVIEVMKTIRGVINEYKDNPWRKQKTTKFIDKETYKEFRLRLNQTMKEIVQVAQSKWLKEWRVLLIGKCSKQGVEEELEQTIDKILKDANIQNISDRSKTLLMQVVKGNLYLDLMEFSRAVTYCLPDLPKNDRIALVQELRKTFCGTSFSSNFLKRHPVILIVDESIDQVPWEMLDVLNVQPISRMQSLHFTYALYKEHEHNIIDGWRVNLDPCRGSYLVNPSQNLPLMEKRLSSFFSYWTPDWKRIIGRTPNEEEYLDILTSSDIFSYSGHGDGFQYVTTTKFQKLRVNAVVLLFGCGSVKLESLGPGCEPSGSSQNFILTCSPCVVGMLWMVPDTDVDVLSANFLSLWVPSKAPVHWKNYEKSKWEFGETDDVTTLPQNTLSPGTHEPNLLIALMKAKKSARQFLTQAACVARGLPVKLS